MNEVDAINCACASTDGNETLAQLRTRLALRMGYAVGNLATHVSALYDDFLTSANRLAASTLARKGESTERWFSWPLVEGEALYDLGDNTEGVALATPTGLASSTATTGGTLAAGTYSYRVSARNRNGETAACVADTQIVPVGTATNTVTLTWTAVAGAREYRIYGRSTGTELLLATIDAEDAPTWTDDGSLTPAGALPTANTTACSKTLNRGAITWVGLVRDNVWTPLHHGIAPGRYGTQTGIPQRYEIRQCIELWPAPCDSTGSLVIKGHHDVLAFAADGDVTTVDSELVFLLALANLKAHYNKPDAGNYIGQYERRLGEIIAGTHQTRRYVPGEREAAVYVMPTPTTPFE